MNIEDFEDEAAHAAWLGVGPRTLRRYTDEPDGGLPFTRRGRKRLYRRAWTVAWLEGRKVERNAPRRRRAA
jgi:hypothetical protein